MKVLHTTLAVAVAAGALLAAPAQADEALAKKYFPGVDPVGRRVQTGFDDRWERIVGVVETVAEAHLTAWQTWVTTNNVVPTSVVK